jgi:uncharacterized protein (TIGR00369 family)
MNQDHPLAAAMAQQGFGQHVGLEFEEVRDDYARVRLPFRPDLVTVADVVHGGAVATLLDSAATAAAWSTVKDPASARGTTIGFSINFLEAARSSDIVAEANVIRRGRSIVYIEVSVKTADREVARGLVSYKLDQ